MDPSKPCQPRDPTAAEVSSRMSRTQLRGLPYTLQRGPIWAHHTLHSTSACKIGLSVCSCTKRGLPGPLNRPIAAQGQDSSRVQEGSGLWKGRSPAQFGGYHGAEHGGGFLRCCYCCAQPLKRAQGFGNLIMQPRIAEMATK